MHLAPFQLEALTDLLTVDPDQGLWRHRQGLWILPRKAGKSQTAAVLALWALVAKGPGAEVYLVAAARDQTEAVMANIRASATKYGPGGHGT